MSMTRGGIIERAVMPATETAAWAQRGPAAPGVAELIEAHTFERETRLRVTYAAHGVPYGDVKALNEAQRKRPSLVRVRMPDGSLNLFGIDLAVTAIQNGGKLEV